MKKYFTLIVVVALFIFAAILALLAPPQKFDDSKQMNCRWHRCIR